MKDLIRKNDLEGLKSISQQEIFNVWYEFGFGLHNTLGIHGACPMELLHWIQLGMYKYSREAIFLLLGPSSQLAQKFNTIASQMGWLFQRQSDRAYPRTKFTKGVQKGTLMAHEMTGLMLVLVATLRSFTGRSAILDANNDNFSNQDAISAWIMLLEVQLQFEAWLKKPEMEVDIVFRLKTKVRELMLMIKLIGKRTKGMGYKTNNFHSTKHVPDDILMFGPPHCVNTKSNEMHHKPDKKSAKSTQKRPKTFDLQCAERVDDRRVVVTAMEELKGRPKWDYFTGFKRQNQLRSDRFVEEETKMAATPDKKARNKTALGGVRAEFWYDDEEGGYTYKVYSTMKRKSRYRYPIFIVDCMADLAEECAEYIDVLTVSSELHLPTAQTYRASPFYQGKPWYDWAMCRVGEPIEGFEHRIVPAQIRCFVDLTFLPEDNTTKYLPGYYMVVEPSRLNPEVEEIQMSDLFVPFLKDEGVNSVNKLELLPVERIVEPACVIADVGHPSKRAFLRVRPMAEWARLFEHWVNREHAVAHQEPNIGE